jgi:NADH-quinone oxidoreductase subunit E
MDEQMVMEKDDLDLIFADFSGKPDELIPVLQAIQKKFGYISQDAVHQAAGFLRVSENIIFGVASFYTQFRFRPPGKNLVRVCLGTACHVQGGKALSEEIEKTLNIRSGETTPDGQFDFQEVACLGCCAQASVVEINGKVYGKMTPAQLSQVLKTYANL